ncbi:hypothetical protein [Clostridium cuniculi]|uniref:hypothetical protein n=1 Tax=Clostridium cuniculi TaxID=2548455 RepID=UPI001055D0A2|nr:hypothetical protein [Clostridium cuniculi]
MKNIVRVLLILTLSLGLIGCGNKTEEIEVPEVTKLLSEGGVNLDYATYKTTEKNEEKTIKVTAAYNEEVMIVGKITGIRNIIESNFSKEYSKIDLTIIQEEPEFTSVNYIFEDGSWNEDVK